MRFACSITTASDAAQAVDEMLETIGARLTPGMVDLAMLFATAHFEDDLPEVIERFGSAFPGATLLGCSAGGTIGGDREVEHGPSMSLLVASMPEVTIRPFHLRQQDLEALAGPMDWERTVGVSGESHPTFLCLADPFRFAVPDFLEQLNEVFPGAPLLGGIASAAQRPLENRLMINGEIHRDGLVGVALTGQLTVHPVVSQGCRPIGRPFVITKGDRNVVRELGGKAALQQLHSVLVSLSPDDEKLAKDSLFVGRVIDEYKDHFDRGDFLIQNIIGVDRGSGAIGIAGRARVGASIQFHVRDSDSADEDLRQLLEPYADLDVCGAAVFGCNGRGTQMWEESGHDIGVLRDVLGDVPAAGFFCGGEFGPIGGRNFVHGFTASIALFLPPEDAPGETP